MEYSVQPYKKALNCIGVHQLVYINFEV